MAERLTALSEFQRGTTFDRAAVEATIARLVSHPGMTMIVAQGTGGDLVGMVGVVVGPHPITGRPVVGEVCWWVDPESRGHTGWLLLSAAEAWARAQGAASMQMVAPTPRYAEVFARRGYAPAGTVFERRL